MTIPLDRVRPSIARRSAASAAGRETLRPVAELLLRSLVVGAGIGAILMSERAAGTLGVVFAGILAIGAALVEMGS